MKFLSSFLLAVALLAGVTATRAEAQLGAGSWEVTPFVGNVSFDDDLFLDNALGFGGRLAYNLTDTWGLEGSVSYTNADFDFQDDFDDDDENLPQTAVMLAHANLNYNVPLNNSALVPYLTAGGGLANFNVDNDDNIDEESETDGEVNAGGGLKLFLSETIAVRGDVRNHWIFASTRNLDPDEPDDERDAQTTSNLEFSGGVTFNF